MTLREKIFEIIEPSSENRLSSYVDMFIMTLIILTVVEVILESFHSFRSSYAGLFDMFETFSVTVFTLEYVLRLLTADLKYKSKNYGISALKFSFSFFGLIDFLAILPFYLPLFLALDLRFIRLLRLIRLFRILKLIRYNSSLLLVLQVLKEKKPELGITLFITFILMLLSSTLMYFVENESQPEAFPNILASFWWAIATLTTVGYGDVYPITGLGKLIASFVAILGIGIVALPTGILSSAFYETIQRKNEKEKCPHCGEELH
jgi:voltage-gated potassium channel